MRTTTKDQITIPQHIREKLGILPATEVDFIEEQGRVYLVKIKRKTKTQRFKKLRRVATVKMTTDQKIQKDERTQKISIAGFFHRGTSRGA